MHLGTALGVRLKNCSQWQKLQECSLIITSSSSRRFNGKERPAKPSVQVWNRKYAVATTNVTTEKGMIILE